MTVKYPFLYYNPHTQKQIQNKNWNISLLQVLKWFTLMCLNVTWLYFKRNFYWNKHWFGKSMFIGRALWQKVIHSCIFFFSSKPVLPENFLMLDQVHRSFLESWQNKCKLWEHLTAAFQLQCVNETEQGRTTPRAWIQGNVKDMSTVKR